MPADPSPAASFLQHVYEDLDLDAGSLIPASSTPTPGADPQVWSDLGDWLLLGARVGAERIFFVHDDPVLVFSSLPTHTSEDEIMALYRRAWSMARPRCLFIEVNDELRVYNLSEPPVAPDETDRTIKPLEIVQRATDVRSALQRFHRDRFESGAAFEDPALSRSPGRADQRLLRDVRAATAALIQGGLAARHAHALIERAILVRYLEDRAVLTEQYFTDLADVNEHHHAAFRVTNGVDFGTPSLFIRCLADKELSYALFSQLAEDFNGDLFVPDDAEHDAVTEAHLRLLGDLLRGVAGASQEPLFLWAYDFSVVPTSLVSTMYELFYHQEVDGRETSTYYTPPDLVEFVLADVLSPDVLTRNPVVCDPACGSGIFLVEAYRRIVRHEAARENAPLSTARLRSLLLERVAGCDIDESAVRLAAFSLYVAFLNYQSPRDIQKAGALPRLISRQSNDDARTPLVVGDAFAPLRDEQEHIDADPAGTNLPWDAHSFDIIIGNPPWSEPLSRDKSQAERWAKRRALPFGDRSPSQLFLWRALDLLQSDGVAALLISAKVLFNTRTTSKAFRARWLSEARVDRVVNFSQVRRDFFEQAVAPFALVRFAHADDNPAGPFIYETARPVPRGRRGSPALSRLDRRMVDQRALRNRDYLWKTYSAGDHHDDALLARLELDGRLADLLPDRPKAQYGYQRARPDERSGHEPDASWREVPSLKKFESWGPLRSEWCEPVPPNVKFAPDPALFLGRRLVVRRLVAARFGPHARLLTEPMAFRHTTYAIPLDHRPEWEGKVALGTLLSSLGRYWLFMVSGSWGTWKDEIRAEQLLDLPLRLDAHHVATARIVAAVDRLPTATVQQQQLSEAAPSPDASSLLRSLDEAVADLFELTSAERDLVEDFWATQHADATKPVPMRPKDQTTVIDHADDELARYLTVFASVWRPLLGDSADLEGSLWRDPHAEVIAAVFETRAPGDPPQSTSEQSAAWSAVLERYSISLDEQHVGGLLAYGALRAVSDSAILIVKRNEQRLWSATAARQDAEATTAQAMALQRA